MTQTLDTIELDLLALDSLLDELGGDISEVDAEAAIDAWFQELGDARDAKLNGYARRIQNLETHAAAKKEEERRLAARRKQEESQADWLKRRLLAFVQTHGAPIKGKETRQFETDLFRFVETKNGGLQSITYLVPPSDLPEPLRTDVLTIKVSAGHEKAHTAVAVALKQVAAEGVDFHLECASRPVDEAVREALNEPEGDAHRYARLEPRGVRLAIR